MKHMDLLGKFLYFSRKKNSYWELGENEEKLKISISIGIKFPDCVLKSCRVERLWDPSTESGKNWEILTMFAYVPRWTQKYWRKQVRDIINIISKISILVETIYNPFALWDHKVVCPPFFSSLVHASLCLLIVPTLPPLSIILDGNNYREEKN